MYAWAYNNLNILLIYRTKLSLLFNHVCLSVSIINVSFSDGWDSQVGLVCGNDVMLLLFQEVGTGKH